MPSNMAVAMSMECRPGFIRCSEAEKPSELPSRRRDLKPGCTYGKGSDTSGWSATRDAASVPAEKHAFLNHIREFEEASLRDRKIESDMERGDACEHHAGIAVTGMIFAGIRTALVLGMIGDDRMDDRMDGRVDGRVGGTVFVVLTAGNRGM